METFVKSHIQMPKCVLKRFEDQNHFLYYYDVIQKKIYQGHAKSLNTKFAYYSMEVENIWGKEVETPLGKIMKFVDETDFSLPATVPANLVDSVWKFIYSLIARSPALIRETNANSVVFKHLPNTKQNDFAAMFAFQFAQEENLLTNYFPTFTINQTEIPFILPMRGMYECGHFINCPISPNKAIALVRKETPIAKQLLADTACKLISINSPDLISEMNKQAFRTEIENNGMYIASSEKEVLEKIFESI